MTEHALKPVPITLLDGREVRLALSMGGAKRLKEKFGVKILAEIFNRDAADSVPILYEGLSKEERRVMSLEEFSELVPADIPLITKTLMALFGVSMPEPQRTPTPASPTVQ